MGKMRDIFTSLHKATQRDCLGRMMDSKVECMEIAKRFDKDFWDGDRRYGYGGYAYDGRQKVIADALISTYNLKENASILDIGCGKGRVPIYVYHRFHIPVIGIDCAEMGVKAITFSGGGEPLVYKYMPQTLRKLVETPIAFATLTNGARLKGEVAELFAKYGTWVRVSMDGYDNESYKKFRSTGKGEFDKIIGNMEAFKKIGGKCYLGVSFIVGQENYHAIYAMSKILSEIGVDSLKISPTITSNESEATKAYHAKIYNEVKEQVARAKADFSSRLEIYDSYHYQLKAWGLCCLGLIKRMRRRF